MNTQAQHTPGPWKLKSLPDTGDGIVATVAHNLKITSNEGVTANAAEHNAHLIAAAPDLLEALRRLAFDVNRTIKFNEDPSNSRTVSDCVLNGLRHDLAEARAAIAKAKGEA